MMHAAHCRSAGRLRRTHLCSCAHAVDSCQASVRACVHARARGRAHIRCMPWLHCTLLAHDFVVRLSSWTQAAHIQGCVLHATPLLAHSGIRIAVPCITRACACASERA
eukprot:13391126-Alexandrium_andersonii.AAC.1